MAAGGTGAAARDGMAHRGGASPAVQRGHPRRARGAARDGGADADRGGRRFLPRGARPHFAAHRGSGLADVVRRLGGGRGGASGAPHSRLGAVARLDVRVRAHAAGGAVRGRDLPRPARPSGALVLAEGAGGGGSGAREGGWSLRVSDHLADLLEPRDVQQEDDEGRGDRHGEQRAGDAPEPRPEDEGGQDD